MKRSTLEAWLEGPGDLKEDEVADVPVPGESVRIRALSGTFNNEVIREALTSTVRQGQNVQRVDTVELDVLRFAHGVIEPKFTPQQARQVSDRYGPAFNKVVAAVVKLSGLNEEEIASTEARFPRVGGSSNGLDVDAPSPAGSGGPDVPARAGARVGDAGS